MQHYTRNELMHLKITTIMDKTEPASETKERKRPDFPQWIETKDGKDCLAWPISEVKYLHNRLFWAFDAGRNCIWDQYMGQKEEITRLKAELEKERELRKELFEVLTYYFYHGYIHGMGYEGKNKIESLIKRAKN
jgi:hypothetical protein